MSFRLRTPLSQSLPENSENLDHLLDHFILCNHIKNDFYVATRDESQKLPTRSCLHGSDSGPGLVLIAPFMGPLALPELASAAIMQTASSVDAGHAPSVISGKCCSGSPSNRNGEPQRIWKGEEKLDAPIARLTSLVVLRHARCGRSDRSLVLSCDCTM